MQQQQQQQPILRKQDTSPENSPHHHPHHSQIGFYHAQNSRTSDGKFNPKDTILVSNCKFKSIMLN